MLKKVIKVALIGITFSLLVGCATNATAHDRSGIGHLTASVKSNPHVVILSKACGGNTYTLPGEGGTANRLAESGPNGWGNEAIWSNASAVHMSGLNKVRATLQFYGNSMMPQGSVFCAEITGTTGFRGTMINDQIKQITFVCNDGREASVRMAGVSNRAYDAWVGPKFAVLQHDPAFDTRASGLYGYLLSCSNS